MDNLLEGNSVLLCGYKIGTVKKIEFKEENNSLKIYVHFLLNSDFLLPKGTIMKIVSLDIMGTRGVDVVRPNHAKEYHKNGDTLLSAVEGGLIDQLSQFIMPIKDDLLGMLLTTDSVMKAVNKLLTNENIDNMSTGLNNLKTITEHLTSNISKVDSMICNFDKTARVIGKNSGNINRAIVNFTNLSDSLSAFELSKMVSEAEKALTDINLLLNTLNNSNGSVQKFMTSDSIYNNVETLTNKLNFLISDFEKHPKKYINLAIFGGKEKKSKKENSKE